MTFSERDLVNFYLENDSNYIYLRGKHAEKCLEDETEFQLPSGKRIDVLRSSNRFDWIIEFKIYADLASVIQVLKYKDEFKQLRRSQGYYLRLLRVSIAAQFFSDDVIFLCKEFGISFIQVAPISKTQVSIHEFCQNLSYRKSSTVVGKYNV